MRCLCFDIGGTNCRMAVCSGDGEIVLGQTHTAPTRKVRDTQELYDATRQLLGQEMDDCQACAMAVAGPVRDGRAHLSNAALALDRDAAERLFAMPVILMNDFTAVCHAVDSPPGRDAEHIRGDAASDSAPRAVIGAGTGLGCAALPVPDTRFCMASEGGHMTFAFHDDEERAFEAFLLKRLKLDWASADDVVTGRGLKALVAWATGQELSGRECGNAFLCHDADDPANTVGRLYARFYGRAARDWALATLCTGGLWIGGGIAVKNRAVIRSQSFAREFVSGAYRDFLERIPIHLFRDESCGLWGAAMAAAALATGAQRGWST